VSPISREITGANVNAYKTVGAKLSVKITPDDSFTIIPAFLYQRGIGDDEPYLTSNIPGPGPQPSQYSTAYLTRFQQQTSQPEPSEDRMGLATLTMEKRFATTDLTMISGYFDRSNYLLTDATAFVVGALEGSPLGPVVAPLLSTSEARNTTRQLSQEIRLASHDPSGVFKWTGGLFYTDTKFNFYQPVTIGGLTNALAAAFGPGTTLQTLVPSARPDDIVFLGNTTNTNREYAAFGEASYDVTSTLSITAGARAFELRQSLDRNAEGFFNGGPTSDHPATNRFDGLDPRFIVGYKIRTDSLLYVSASKGYRPGLVNNSVPVSRCAADLAALGRTGVPSGAAPDSLWNYEFGTKNKFLAGRLRINAAAFQMVWADIQLSVALPTCGFSFEDNVGKARIRGAELEMDAQVANGVTVGLSGAYLDARITEAKAGVTYKAGDALPNTPKQFYTAYVQYEREFGTSVRGFVRADYQHRGDAVRESSALSAQADYVYKGWDVTNLNVGTEWQAWDVRLFVNNLFNQDPDIDFRSSWGQWRVATLRPRTLGLSVEARF
jgi:outer membrane receptor protein involved in Fe transport